VLITCTVQRDVVHAGYLALALIAFRQQQQQQQVLVSSSSRSTSVTLLAAGRVFGWLQVFNFCVMAAMLVYQVWGRLKMDMLLIHLMGKNQSTGSTLQICCSSITTAVAGGRTKRCCLSMPYVVPTNASCSSSVQNARSKHNCYMMCLCGPQIA
jgi:hypothetical protein